MNKKAFSVSVRMPELQDSLSVSQERDDGKRQHPCLVEFSKLPDQEHNYNLQMSQETLK